MGSAAQDMRLALDPVAFAKAVGVELDPWQSELVRSNAPRALLNCSRQAGKSTVAAVKGLHTALYVPNAPVLIFSRALRQSTNLFDSVHKMLWRLAIRPKLDKENASTLVFPNGSSLTALPGTEATVRSFSGVKLLLMDEAARIPDSLYMAVRPMLAVSGGSLWQMSTPFGRRGFFHDSWAKGGDRWARYEVPATMCPRIAPEFLAEERAAMGEWWFQQEYMCQFMDQVGQVFASEQIEAALRPELEPLVFN